MRRGMVVTQVALSLVLLTAGGLVARSFERLLRADPGFQTEGVLTLRVPISEGLYAEPEEAIAVQDRLQQGLAALPGVTGVGATSALPLSADASQTTIRVPGAPGNTGDEDHDAPLIDRIMERPGYMEAMGMRLLAGRTLEDRGEDGMTDVVVDHAFAEYFFPSGNPLGAIIPYGADSGADRRIGVPATFFVGGAVRGLLVGVSPTDPMTLAAVGVGLGTVALTACYLPARRVLRIEPARSLREE